MQRSVDDQQCYLRKLQEEEEELVNSLDRLQESPLTVYPIPGYSNASRCYKIHPVLITFIEESMSQWKTNKTLVHKEGVLETGPNKNQERDIPG